MSQEQRDLLAQQIMDTQPSLSAFVHEHTHDDMMTGNWDLLAYSYQRGFEALWDAALSDHSGLLISPLLLLWRQSVELSIKSAILSTAGAIDKSARHDLSGLFKNLLESREAEGFTHDDDLTRQVSDMIATIQTLDPFADRFRYPSSNAGVPYRSVEVELNSLFKSFWVVTTWCDGASIEIDEMRGYG